MITIYKTCCGNNINLLFLFFLLTRNIIFAFIVFLRRKFKQVKEGALSSFLLFRENILYRFVIDTWV